MILFLKFKLVCYLILTQYRVARWIFFSNRQLSVNICQILLKNFSFISKPYERIAISSNCIILRKIILIIPKVSKIIVLNRWTFLHKKKLIKDHDSLCHDILIQCCQIIKMYVLFKFETHKWLLNLSAIFKNLC